MLALIGNLQFSELLIVGIIAILIFGRRLPQVAGQAAAYVGKTRRTIEALWRETGIEDEVRNVRREIERYERKLPRKVTPGELARRATDAIWKDLDKREAESDAEKDAASPAEDALGVPREVAQGGDATPPETKDPPAA